MENPHGLKASGYLLGLFLLILTCARAQGPEIVAIPSGIAGPELQSLTAHRDALVDRRTELNSRVQAHNAKCRGVEAGSSQAQECRGQQALLQEEVSSFIADVRSFNNDVARTAASPAPKPPTAATPKTTEQRIEQLQFRLADLRNEIADIQKALRELNKSIAGDQKERAFWEKSISDSSQRARERALNLTVDGVLGAIGDRFSAQIKDADSEIARAKDELAHETAANRREQLQAALQWLSRDKAAIEDKQVLLVDAGKTFNDRAALLRDVGKDESSQQLLALAYQGLYGMLDHPAYQQALHFSEKYAPAARWAKAAVDSTYDAASVCLGWRTTYQLNQNAEQYRVAVSKLEERMKATMEKLQSTESQLEISRGDVAR
jgi:predicted  nucleic acid-binding Zn-ribbon protein